MVNRFDTLWPTPHITAEELKMLTEPQMAADRQIGGDHYRSKKIQPWTAMESWMTPEEFEGFLRGNVIKYIARYKDKDGMRDVLKAKHYLDRLEEHLRQHGGNS